MKVTDIKLTICPSCGKETFNKQLTAPGFQLKGSGWYATDFKGGPKPPADDADTKSDSKSDAKPDTKTNTKPDAKSDAKPTPVAEKKASATTPSTPAPTSGAKAVDRK